MRQFCGIKCADLATLTRRVVIRVIKREEERTDKGKGEMGRRVVKVQGAGNKCKGRRFFKCMQQTSGGAKGEGEEKRKKDGSIS